MYDSEPMTPAAQSLLVRLSNKLLRGSAENMVYTTTTPPSSNSCVSCGCCSVMFSVLFLIVGLVCFITVYSLWGHVIAGSTELTGLATKYMGLQGHYTFTGFMDGAAQSLAQANIASTTQTVAVLHGWFDLHAQRTDWDVVLFQDTFGLFLAPNPSGQFYLWARRFNKTTHVLDHAAGSPWPLGSVRTGSKTGNDLPPFLARETEPLFYSFVIQSTHATWSVPLYT